MSVSHFVSDVCYMCVCSDNKSWDSTLCFQDIAGHNIWLLQLVFVAVFIRMTSYKLGTYVKKTRSKTYNHHNISDTDLVSPVLGAEQTAFTRAVTSTRERKCSQHLHSIFAENPASLPLSVSCQYCPIHKFATLKNLYSLSIYHVNYLSHNYTLCPDTDSVTWQ